MNTIYLCEKNEEIIEAYGKISMRTEVARTTSIEENRPRDWGRNIERIMNAKATKAILLGRKVEGKERRIVAIAIKHPADISQKRVGIIK